MKNLYEIHLTVSETLNLDEFKETCKKFKVKPIYLDLVTPTEVMKDLMTSEVLKANSLAEVMEHIKEFSLSWPYKIIRVKVETPMQNTNDSCIYYECHISTPSIVEYSFDFRVSKNTLKQGTFMYTLRETNKELFERKMQRFIATNEVLKVIAERCVYDSNRERDNKWMK